LAPDWALKGLTLLLAIGLPIWIIISWIYDITPQGIEKTTKDSGSELVSQATNKRLNAFIIVSLSVAVIVMGLKLSNVFSSNTDNQYAIAILPFDNIKVDKGNEWLSIGFTTDINSYLSRVKSLQVTDPHSSRKYKDSKKNNTVIGKELKVSRLLKGSLRQIGNKLTITVRLINVITGKVDWSESYQESFEENALKLQQEVSKKIVQQLKIELSPQEKKDLKKYATKNIKAQLLFSEGLSFADLRGNENLEKSVALFQQAIDLDSNYAEAYAEMAFTLRLMAGSNKIFENMNKNEKINSLINKSLEINPNTSHAYITLGALEGYRKGNWKKMKEYFEKAIEIKPNDATNQLYYALYLGLKTNPDYKKALEHINIAQKINPHSYPINRNKISYLLRLDKFTEAEEFYENNNSFFTEDMKSGMQFSFIVANARKVSLEKKDWTEAISFYHKEIEKDPENARIHSLLANAYNEILLDAKNYIKHAEKGYILDTTDNFVIGRTHNKSLFKAKKNEELLQIIKDYNWDVPLITYYYSLGDYKKSQFYLDKYSSENSIAQVIVYAQQNKIKKTYRVLNSGNLRNYEKARVFAILKERDSMYYFINKEKDIYNIREFNSYFEVDPYRKEERFKAFLKKNYLPLTNWNE